MRGSLTTNQSSHLASTSSPRMLFSLTHRTFTYEPFIQRISQRTSSSSSQSVRISSLAVVARVSVAS
eukprot:767810-Hanusia_phi.AAC.3